MPIFLKVAGVLKLNFYWLKGFRKTLLTKAQKLLTPVEIELRKPLGLTFFHRFLHIFPEAIENPFFTVTGSFQDSFMTALAVCIKSAEIIKGIVSRDFWPPFFVIKLILLRL
jgi:hypothetical protein